MEPNTTNANPLGLNLDFLFGRGYLWARGERLSDWINLDHLRMEIPDLSFPFDARGGLNRFRNTRCLVRELEISTSEVGLGDLLRQSSTAIQGFDSLDVHFLDGAVHVTTRVRSLGANTWLSFKFALIPPEPARADEVHLSVYDYRSFGPLPFPARLLAFEFITRLLNSPGLRPPGRGQSFTVGIAGDILSLRPLKLMLLHIFPGVGWKLPNLSNVTLEGAHIRPGLMTLRAASHDPGWTSHTPQAFHVSATAEGARALAAYEAKDLFSHGDQALFARQMRQALELYSGYRDIYGLHPELVSRLFDVLLCDPTPSNLAHAEAVCRELESDDPTDLRARFARPLLAQLNGRREQVIPAFQRLAEGLRERGDTHDWILAQLAMADYLVDSAPSAAANHLREVLKLSPRNRVALEMLRSIYETEGDVSGLEEVLKRLTGVYTDRESLTLTYLTLAQHLMDRQGEVGEARIYLERVLRLDPGQLEALDILGESYLVSEEPLRALKAFGSAARAAEARQLPARAARLHIRMATIWEKAVEDPTQALLSVRRAISLTENLPEDGMKPGERISFLEAAIELCEQRERWEEAVGYRVDAIPMLEILIEQSRGEDREFYLERALRMHRDLARSYESRQRSDAAASHWRRVLDASPGDEEAATRLEAHYKMGGRPEQLITLYQDLLKAADSPEAQVEHHLRLADLYRSLALQDEAAQHIIDAISLNPNSVTAREALESAMTASRQFDRWRDVLVSLMPRITERGARWAASISLANANMKLEAFAEATRNFMESIQLRPAELDGLFGARNAIEALISQKSHDITSPMGDGSAALLLERLAGRIGEVAPDVGTRVEAFIRVAELATIRGDAAAGAEARRRADALATPASSSVDVDSRLDDILDESFPKATPGASSLAAFRKTFDKSSREHHSVPRPEDVEPETALSRVLRRDQFESSEPTMQVTPLPQPAAGTNQALLEEAAAAMQSDDENRKVTALTEVVEAANQGRLNLDLSAQIGYARQLGELLYYDLEDSNGALPHLEFVREHDPQGSGASPGVLNALESIYEDQGRIDGRIKILEERLARAESREMDTVYRLLLAQLVWDEKQDRPAAVQWLEKVLAGDARHEAAHRLLADIAMDVEDWDAAAEHLRTVLAVSTGGLDTVEVERELAELLMTKLDRPRQAIAHFRKVLEAAPGDSGALESVKQGQAALGDWEGYAQSLCLELGMLLGRQNLTTAALKDMDLEKVPASLRMPAGQILSDLATVAQDELLDPEMAWRLWGEITHLLPEHVEAFERRIDLGRHLKQDLDLARDLEAYADLLLDPLDRFGNLVESASLFAASGDRENARIIYTQALAIVDGLEHLPPEIDEARRAMQALTNEPD
jgi:tetratricopeptide (TPR) repeat protein